MVGERDGGLPVRGIECVVCGGSLVRKVGEDAYYCKQCCITRLPVPRGTVVEKRVHAALQEAEDEGTTLTEEELNDIVGYN